MPSSIRTIISAYRATGTLPNAPAPRRVRTALPRHAPADASSIGSVNEASSDGARELLTRFDTAQRCSMSSGAARSLARRFCWLAESATVCRRESSSLLAISLT